MVKWAFAALAAVVVVLLTANSGFAGDPVMGAPHDWQTGLQDAHSPTMSKLNSFHNALVIIIIVIAAFVTALLAWVMIRYNKRRNPVPQKWSHNTMLEMAWTAIPVIILLGIVIPSLRLLYFEDRASNPEMTLKAIGHQWYWSYEYPDAEGVGFDAIVLEDGDLKEGQRRLLETDNEVMLPVDTDIRLIITADDVIHSWAMPSLGVKLDAVPGRLNETWVRINDEGIYYGQCSELCGTNHGFMPIKVHAVSKDAYKSWIETKHAALTEKGARARVARADAAVQAQ
jgi:cytochrome c oxidase subunit 2